MYSTITLRKGETSKELYIPGFDFCLATMKIRLDDLEAPDTRARFSINGNPLEVKQGERFLNNKCRLHSLQKIGLNQEVSFSCREDREGFHKGDRLNLKIIPNISLSVEGDIKNVSVGDYLYKYTTILEKEKKVFLAYAGTNGQTGKEEDLYVYLMAIPSKEHTSDKLTLGEIQSAEKIAKLYVSQTNPDRKSVV